MLTAARTACTHHSHPLSQPDFFLPNQVRVPSSVAPTLSSFVKPHQRQASQLGLLPTLVRIEVPFCSGNRGQRIMDLETSIVLPIRSHQAHTYAYPRVHTQ